MSPRTPQQYTDLREESRARIMEAALTLFAHYGYDGTSIKMIAQEAGVAQGLLYNYFASKEALLRAIFDHSIADVRASFAHAEAAAVPDTITTLIQASFAIVREHIHFWRLSYGVRMQPTVLASLGNDVLTWADEIRSTLEGYFQRVGVPQPQTEAAILFALIDGVAQHYVLDPEHYPLEAVEQALLVRYGGRS
jgi:AcrR family transcriptional regulator